MNPLKELALLIVLITSCASLPQPQGKKTTPAPERKERWVERSRRTWSTQSLGRAQQP